MWHLIALYDGARLPCIITSTSTNIWWGLSLSFLPLWCLPEEIYWIRTRKGEGVKWRDVQEVWRCSGRVNLAEGESQVAKRQSHLLALILAVWRRWGGGCKAVLRGPSADGRAAIGTTPRSGDISAKRKWRNERLRCGFSSSWHRSDVGPEMGERSLESAKIIQRDKREQGAGQRGQSSKCPSITPQDNG